jgi:hypothetical protein
MTTWTKIGWIIVALIVLAVIVFLWNLPTGSESHVTGGMVLVR